MDFRTLAAVSILATVGAPAALACEYVAVIVATAHAEGAMIVGPDDSERDESEPRRIPVRPNLLLPPGTKIDFTQAKDQRASVDLQLDLSVSDPVPVTRSKRRRLVYTMPGDCERGIWDKMFGFAEQIIEIATGGGYPNSIAQDAKTAAPQRGTPQDDAEAPVFKRLPEVAFQVEAGRPHLFAAWSGAAGFLVLSDPETGAELARSILASNGRISVALPTLEPGRTVNLFVESIDGLKSASRQVIIMAAGSAPMPEGELAGAPEMVAAAWRYYQAAPEWRLDALAVLESHRDSDFLALKVWRDAVTDEPD